MTIELKIPHVGESIQEVQIGHWLKQPGDYVNLDEALVELETDKATVEIPAPAVGVLKQILKQQGESVSVGETIAYFDETDEKPAAGPAKSKVSSPSDSNQPAPKSAAKESPSKAEPLRQRSDAGSTGNDESKLPAAAQSPPTLIRRASDEKPGQLLAPDQEEVVPMTLIRRRIAQRLVDAQQTAALLTTFNEVDMSAVKELRQNYGEAFRERYGVKLGFMSFFVKAVIDGLKVFPVLNAEVRGTDIVYRNYFHIGIAVAADRGLVVPVLRHAERMSFAEVEQAIGELSDQARNGKLKPEDLTGGTFTISNGGVYGSLLSTPIVNPPQSGVLGMHAIEDRPVARAGQVVIRPMMYIALTYDHRIVDGREAVTFLRRVRELIEEPARMLLET
jgi:2-oxoglutarate dehydrogenase E2 component (dihydrolipoamide succinyltransferase)